ncbi:mesoderm induction early response protein 1 [Drosophila nasuta]|uniref:mesoderm induction early response protein 1 n=1 Tax=Drosophila nasuta TaxID=42062 RepID=UPI00295F3B1E|nr:mesoderm induction early response protein 1 [Drosophila nasuta]
MAGRELTITPTKRERRKSPAMSFTSDSSSVQPPPMSPSSSVADTTFEPTIDMMVNDFDDEATLNEEEALADQEAHNPEDEIATLREESEMPIEELLAKYSSMPTTSPVATSSFKRSSGSSRRRRATKRQHQETDSAANAQMSTGADEVSNEPITTATGQEAGSSVVQTDDDTMTADDCTTLPAESCNDVDAGHHEAQGVLPPEVSKKHRSHLLDLYPGETFASSAQQTLHAMEDLKSFTPLQTLFDEVEEEEEEDESDTESDDARKIIMVGPDYQADIPEGLSQYGDILPYENEDQLIWEPSQVTEREVEDYLAKIQETRALTTSTDEAAVAVADMAEGEENTTAITEDAASIATPATVATANPTTANLDSESVVKDNEQALHLLVQCGYDFKEALRRKRLNVLPLSDTMSSWSEEECQKFEEGIHKFGKDFYQIRQNQVRTRTMRELVQFYYLWKKSERRDQSFALNDTIDHMDVFLNEGGNGNITSNVATAAGVGNGNGNGSCSSQASSCSSSNGHSNANVNTEASALDKEAAATVARKSTTKNYSIMTGSHAGGGSGGGGGNASATSRKRGASFALDNEDNEQDAENVTIDSLS